MKQTDRYREQASSGSQGSPPPRSLLSRILPWGLSATNWCVCAGMEGAGRPGRGHRHPAQQPSPRLACPPACLSACPRAPASVGEVSGERGQRRGSGSFSHGSEVSLVVEG